MVDAPLDPKPAAQRPASAPIRVQVSENGEAGPPKPKAPDVRPEEMSALVDAFGAPEPEGSSISPLEAAAAEEAAEEPIDADALLSKLDPQADAPDPAAPAPVQSASEPAPEEPRPAAWAKPKSPLQDAPEEDVSGLLDALGGADAKAAPDPPAPPEIDTSRTLVPGSLMSP